MIIKIVYCGYRIKTISLPVADGTPEEKGSTRVYLLINPMCYTESRGIFSIVYVGKSLFCHLLLYISHGISV